MEQNREYFAFVSYSRQDEKWAKTLHGKIEHYRIPSHVRRQNKSLPEKIQPIFRDTIELSGGVLAKEIQTALRQSKFLIVICSPNSAKSPWVDKEIQTFIDLGREENIIPFIIDGIPFSKDEHTECFPPALRSLKEERELLGINISEINRDAASIKVIARMFGLKFDTLWQRYEREQRLKRWMWFIGAILIALIGLGIGIYFVRQNKVIESQNTQLHNLVKNLEEENNTYSLLQSDQKHYVFVGQIRGSGCFNVELMDYAYHPYEPIIAFTDNLGIWFHYLNSNVEINLPSLYKGEQIIEIVDLRFSADGTQLIASGVISDWTELGWTAKEYVWDVESGELIGPSILDEDNSVWKSKDTRLSKEIKYEFINGELYLYNKKGTNICSTNFESDDSNPSPIYNPIYDEILFVSKNRAALYDDTKKDFVLFFKGYNNMYEIEFSEYGDYLRIENNIYERAIKIDTIQDIRYSVHRIEDYPQLPEEKNTKYDPVNHASLDVNEDFIVYRRGNYVKRIEVVKEYTFGNLQEYLKDVLFAGPYKVIAIVEQGKFRIYNSKTWNLLGTLTNYIWTDVEGGSIDFGGLGHEQDLGHSTTYIALAKYINNKLYVLSSGGIIRIYDVNKYRLERVIVLPIERNGEDLSGQPVDKCYLSDDASRIIYSFGDQPFYYECELPQKK